MIAKPPPTITEICTNEPTTPEEMAHQIQLERFLAGLHALYAWDIHLRKTNRNRNRTKTDCAGAITLYWRIIEGKALKEIGALFDVSRERIRQIEAKALRMMRHPSRHGWKDFRCFLMTYPQQSVHAYYQAWERKRHRREAQWG